LIFSLWGAWAARRGGEHRPFRALSVCALGVCVVEFKHFDWWGGWSYGYRHLVDVVPFLTLLLTPVVERILAAASLRRIFATMVCWSILVQAVGAFAFEFGGWNGRRVSRFVMPGDAEPTETDDPAEVFALRMRPGLLEDSVEQNIDLPRYRHRLWSWSDSQILFYLRHFFTSLALRRSAAEAACDADRLGLAATYREMGRIWLQQGEAQRSTNCLEKSLQFQPGDASTLLALVDSYLQARRPDSAEQTANSVLATAPRTAAAHRLLSRALSMQGREDEALDAMRQACRIEPTNDDLLQEFSKLKARRSRDGDR
jgi:Flp pilus assembly protein TadD